MEKLKQTNYRFCSFLPPSRILKSKNRPVAYEYNQNTHLDRAILAGSKYPSAKNMRLLAWLSRDSWQQYQCRRTDCLGIQLPSQGPKCRFHKLCRELLGVMVPETNCNGCLLSFVEIVVCTIVNLWLVLRSWNQKGVCTKNAKRNFTVRFWNHEQLYLLSYHLCKSVLFFIVMW